MEKTGLRIKQIRLGKCMSQEELATRVGFKAASGICRIEKGERILKADMIRKIADALEVAPATLLEEPSAFIPVDPKYADFLIYLPALANTDSGTLLSIQKLLDMNTKKSK